MSLNIIDIDILQDPAFIGAFEQLMNQVSPARSWLLHKEMEAHLRALNERRPTSHSRAMGVSMVIAILHVELGTPLHLTDELLDAWERNAGTATECEHCGYRMPIGHRRCILCGYRTGIGSFIARTRARMVMMN